MKGEIETKLGMGDTRPITEGPMLRTRKYTDEMIMKYLLDR